MSTKSYTSEEFPAAVGRLAAVSVGVFVVTVVLGFLTTLGPIESFNVDSFEPIVEGLQSIGGLTDASETLTDAGLIRYNYLMLAAIAVLSLIRFRSAEAVPWIVVAILAIGLLRPFQGLVARLVEGSEPASDLVIGTAGPFFSGGVFRFTIVIGLLLALFALPNRVVFLGAVIAGVLEGITRMTLGLHWILDAVLAVPIALGVLWCLLESRRILATFVPVAAAAVSPETAP